MLLSGSSPPLGLPSAFRVFALPLVSRSICPPGRIVAPEGPQIPAGCVCYPASCLRTRVVKKILATGGWLEEGIMRGWACAASDGIFFGWLITAFIFDRSRCNCKMYIVWNNKCIFLLVVLRFLIIFFLFYFYSKLDVNKFLLHKFVSSLSKVSRMQDAFVSLFLLWKKQS